MKALIHETPIEELFEDQLACADMVLLTKSDMLETTERDRTQNWLETQVPTGVKVVPCHQGEISPEILLGFNAAVEDNLESRHSHHDHEEDHDHDDHITSISLELEQEFQPKDIISRLQRLVETQEVYRIKGFVPVPGKPMRMVLQGVGQRFDHFFDRPWKTDEPRMTKLVVIGNELNQSEILSALSQ